MMSAQTFATRPASLFAGVIATRELAGAHYATASGQVHEAVEPKGTKEKTCKATRNPCCKSPLQSLEAQHASSDLMMV